MFPSTAALTAVGDAVMCNCAYLTRRRLLGARVAERAGSIIKEHVVITSWLRFMRRVAQVLVCGCACIVLSREFGARWKHNHATLIGIGTVIILLASMLRSTMGSSCRPPTASVLGPGLYPHRKYDMPSTDNPTEMDQHAMHCKARPGSISHMTVACDLLDARSVERFDVGLDPVMEVGSRAALYPEPELPPEVIQKIYYYYVPLYMAKMKLAHHQLLHEDHFLRLTEMRFDCCVDFEFAWRLPDLDRVYDDVD
jgi:hypothetical protein